MLVRQATVHTAAGLLNMREDVLQESLTATECYPCGYLLTGSGGYELAWPVGAIVAAAEHAVRQGRALASTLARAGRL